MYQKNNYWPFMVAAIILFYGASALVQLWVDLQWFTNLGYSDVMLKILFTKIKLGVIVGFSFFAIIALNVFLADYLSRTSFIKTGENTIELPGTEMMPLQMRLSAFGVVAFLSLVTGIEAATHWTNLIEFRNAISFNLTDPIFNKDVSFYVFRLPLINSIYQWLITCAMFSIAATIFVYFMKRAVVISNEGFHFSGSMAAHISILAALVLLLKSFGYRLFAYGMIYTSRGYVAGPGYTDVNIRIPILGILSIMCIIAAIALAANAYFKGLKIPIAVVLAISLFSGIGSMYPEIIQRLRVKPNEISMERPYIENQIKFTREAYNLDSITVKEFPADQDLTAESIENNPLTIKNVRLWDTRPLLQTYQQLQGIRPYYSFSNVDIDRYDINGELRQVMLSARELSYNKLPNKNWINARLTFTHGYGVCMTPVNRFTKEGMPEFYIKDIPSVHTTNVTVQRPQIYYGELSSDYVITKTGADEFDYPKSGDQNMIAKYDGTGGIPINNLLKKLIFAIKFSALDILMNTDIHSESRIMMYRSINDVNSGISRMQKIMPLIAYDSDPYIAIIDGKLQWIIDAYTISKTFPYSQKTGGHGVSGFNYIRNSVKTVVDAYDGSVTFYAFDNSDPIIQSYSHAFPGLFKSLDQISPELLSHIRYPVDMFKVQASIYAVYQMTDPLTFYNKEDMWTNPRELFDQNEIPMEPYYTIMKLPDEQKEEFILMMPFTPVSKDNLSAWMCARNDGHNYGELLVYRFPKKKLVFGPFQIEARIDQDPEISRQLSLWSQKGSQIIRGNLLVIPVDNSLLYVEPLFLKADKGEIPELKRVIVSIGNSVSMEPTLEEALQKLLGNLRTESTSLDGTPPGQTSIRETTADLISESLEKLREAKRKVSNLDWQGFGEDLELLEQYLAELQKYQKDNPGQSATGTEELAP